MKTSKDHQTILELIENGKEIPENLLYCYKNENIYRLQWIPQETISFLQEIVKKINSKNQLTISGMSVKGDVSFKNIEEYYKTLLPIIELKYPITKSEKYELKDAYFIGYQADKVNQHVGHCDDSDITINLCVGDEFSGGNLLFGLQRNLVYKLSCIQKPGKVFIHEGFKSHGAAPITKGERYNLIYLLKKKKIIEKGLVKKNTNDIGEDCWFTIISFMEIQDILKLSTLNQNMLNIVKEQNFIWNYLFGRDFGEFKKDTSVNYQKYREMYHLIKLYPLEVDKKLKRQEGISNTLSTVKVVVLGDVGVGKSSLVIKYIQGNFVDDYDPTIEDSYRKRVEVDNETLMYDILDTSFVDESSMKEQYLRNGEVYLVLYSITDRKSFENLDKYFDMINKAHDGNDNCGIVLVGTKLDLKDERQVDRSEGLKMAFKNNAQFLETSALHGTNVYESFDDGYRLYRYHQIYSMDSIDSSKKKDKCIVS